MTVPQPPLATHGAIDLSTLAKPAGASSEPASTTKVDITEANFAEVVQGSLTTPVILALVSDASPACKDLVSRLAALVDGYGGELVWGAVDIDRELGIAQAFQVTAVPSVLALIGGRPAPLFQGNADDQQITSVLDQVVSIARQAGGVTAEPDAAEPEAPLPPLHQEAYAAIERDDLSGAADAFSRALAANPRDADARAGLAQVDLMLRTQGADHDALRQQAEASPQDIDAQLAVADIECLAGNADAAFSRLLGVIRGAVGDDRERVRKRLVELFEVVGGEDSRVLAARKELASLLN